MQKKLYFGSNLKMYKNIQDTVAYLQKLVENTKDISRDEIELFIIPSYTTLESATKNVDRDYVLLGGGGHINTAGAQFPYSDMERAIETLKKTIDIMIEEGDI